MNLIERLQKILKSNQTNERKSNLILDDESAIIRYFNMPKMKKKELLESVKWELKDELEFGLDDYTIRAVYLEENDGINNVMAVAVLTEKIDHLEKQANDLELKIDCIELKQVSELSNEKINFYTREKKYQEFFKIFYCDNAVCTLTAVIACVWIYQLGYYLYLNNEIEITNKNISNLAAVKTDYETAIKKNQIIKKRMVTLKSINNENYTWSEILTNLEGFLQDDCMIYEIRNNKNIVEIFAKTYDLNNAFLFCELLRGKDNIKNVELVNAKQASSGMMSEFVLKIDLEG